MKPLYLLPLAFLSVSLMQADPLIVAHRGASADAPENTLAAFQKAWNQGADAIEGDFRLTKDGQIVTMHDASTKRTTGRKFVVAETDWATLKDLEAGSWKEKKWAGEKIPLLSEVLAAMPKGKGIFIEVKCGPEIVPVLFETIASSKVALEQVTVIAFDKEVIRAVKKREPKVTANWLSGFKKGKKGAYAPDLDSVIRILKDVGADGLGAQAVGKLAEDLGAELRKHDLGYHAWTIDSAEVGLQFVEAGVQSVTTNVPRKMRDYLAVKKASR
ncbi:glycerophosphodiester phosphodiesterase [Akkermansiaceae bacterium]|nr:glycerophosphodiester phosphodiesterase [Akkermansiaceae bacterium]MDB4804863.1 glycerophosphodiester phosphodiesterase [Akkermansiaceae bacterium]